MTAKAFILILLALTSCNNTRRVSSNIKVLDSSKSYDEDGKIEKRSWKVVSGSCVIESANAVSTKINIPPGAKCIVELTVVDDKNSPGKQTREVK
jgi:hypothetical protein